MTEKICELDFRVLIRHFEHFRTKYTVPIGTSCWIWHGTRNANGYGVYGNYTQGRSSTLAHRLMYEHCVGPIKEGLELDHLCRVRCCVNPQHMEPVAHVVNINRGRSGEPQAEEERSKTHCPQGHAYDEKNTYRNKLGHRTCRTCRREWDKTRGSGWSRQRAAIAKQQLHLIEET